MIEFYATTDVDSIRDYMPDVPYLLPASSWSRKGLKAPRLPSHVTHTAADCGGFVATFKWGDYKYTPEQYADWLATFSPRWAATMDYCCEDEITSGNPGIVRERQDRTTAMAYRFWQDYQGAPWAWVPTVQGWEVEDYRRHAQELRPLVTEMQAHYGAGTFRVGIGTLCRRASPATIRRVVGAVANELPGVPLHLWGIKLSTLQNRIALPAAVVSVDSAAWNALFGSGLEIYKMHSRAGMTQRRYTYTVALPAYLIKFAAALAAPKQLSLLEIA